MTSCIASPSDELKYVSNYLALALDEDESLVMAALWEIAPDGFDPLVAVEMAEIGVQCYIRVREMEQESIH